MSEYIMGAILGLIVICFCVLSAYNTFTQERKSDEKIIEDARIELYYYLKTNTSRISSDYINLCKKLDSLETRYLINYGKPYEGVKRDE